MVEIPISSREHHKKRGHTITNAIAFAFHRISYPRQVAARLTHTGSLVIAGDGVCLADYL
jgi:hypothetical protein